MVSLFIGIPDFKISLESLLTKEDSDVQYIKAKSSALWIKLAMFLLQLSSTHWREEVIEGWEKDEPLYPNIQTVPIISVLAIVVSLFCLSWRQIGVVTTLYKT